MSSGTRHSALGTRLIAEVKAAAAGRLLVAFDLDGTLVRITRHHGTATLRPSTRELLRRVAERYPTVVLTGRSRKDAAARLRGIGLAGIVGNHGLETGARHERARACVRRWMTALAHQLPASGVSVEDKGETMAIHFRGARHPAETRRLIARALATLSPRPRIVGGKALFNVLPDVGVHKGTALRHQMRLRRARRAVFVGDDLTDEDVFRLPRSAGVVTVRVGRSRRSLARFSIPSQRYIDDLLRALIDAGRE